MILWSDQRFLKNEQYVKMEMEMKRVTEINERQTKEIDKIKHILLACKIDDV